MTILSKMYALLGRGSFVAIYPSGSKKTIVFQYNPETVSRTIKPKIEYGRGIKDGRFTGAPAESITIDIKVQSVDELNWSNPLALLFGIFPRMSAFESMVFPPSKEVKKYRSAEQKGQKEITPIMAPLVLLNLSIIRVIPVALESYSITEEAFDKLLNPIRASLKLSLRVLTYEDFDSDSQGYSYYLNYLSRKEKIAKLNLPPLSV